MNEELTRLLIVLAVSVPAGLIVAVFLRKKKPGWCKSAAKRSLNRKWWFFALAALMFLGMAILEFFLHHPYFAVFFLFFACLQLYALIRHGFKELTPEMEARIDASDPTRLWPLTFWKQAKNRESEKPKEV